MTYASLTKKIKSLPEECLDEIDNYIDFVLFKAKKNSKTRPNKNMEKYFGAVSVKEDGLAFQKDIRDEWN